MKLPQSNVLEGNKLNCFKATQVLGGSTQIKGWPGDLVSRGDLKF